MISKQRNISQEILDSIEAFEQHRKGKQMHQQEKYTATNLKALDSLKDIDYSDIPELDEEFFKHAALIEPKKKQSLTVRFDIEVIDYFKNTVGKGYQTRMNAVLKAYVKSHQKHDSV